MSTSVRHSAPARHWWLAGRLARATAAHVTGRLIARLWTNTNVLGRRASYETRPIRPVNRGRSSPPNRTTQAHTHAYKYQSGKSGESITILRPATSAGPHSHAYIQAPGGIHLYLSARPRLLAGWGRPGGIRPTGDRSVSAATACGRCLCWLECVCICRRCHRSTRRCASRSTRRHPRGRRVCACRRSPHPVACPDTEEGGGGSVEVSSYSPHGCNSHR